MIIYQDTYDFDAMVQRIHDKHMQTLLLISGDWLAITPKTKMAALVNQFKTLLV